MQVEAFLELSAQKSPQKTALVCGEQRLSYQDLEAQCNRLAHALRDVGVQRGDRVAVYLENSVEAVITIFAILKAGAVFMPVNPTTKTDKLTYVLNNSRARGLITHYQKRATVEPCLGETPHMETVVFVGKAVAVASNGHKRVVSWDSITSKIRGWKSMPCRVATMKESGHNSSRSASLPLLEPAALCLKTLTCPALPMNEHANWSSSC